MRTWAIEIGLCGWGVSGGLVPEIRLGVIRFWTCSGSVAGLLKRLQGSLALAANELRRGK